MGSQFKGKEERTICYNARDEYFACAEGLTKEADPKVGCKKLYEQFEKTCGTKWLEHFIRRRDYLKFKDNLEKNGIDALDDKLNKAKK